MEKHLFLHLGLITAWETAGKQKKKMKMGIEIWMESIAGTI